MAEAKTIRINKVLREFNISLDRAVEFLSSKGYEVEARPTTKISDAEYKVLFEEFQTDKSKKVEAKEVGEEKRKEKEELRVEREREIEEKQPPAALKVIKATSKLQGPKQVGKIDLNPSKKEQPKEVPVKEEEVIKNEPTEVVKVVPKEEIKKVVNDTPKEEKTLKDSKEKAEKPATETPKGKETEVAKNPPITAIKKADPDEVLDTGTVTTQYKKLDGPNFTGEKIDLTKFKKPEKKKDEKKDANKEKRGKRRRISKQGSNPSTNTNNRDNLGKPKGRTNVVKEEPSEEEVQKQVRETLEKLQGKSSKGKGAKYRREKRDSHRQKSEDEMAQMEADSKLLKVTEFVTVSEVATMMNVPVTQVISACMSLGMMVTMNQRLDAETLSIVAEEFGYEVEFVTADIEEAIFEKADAPEDLIDRAPIVTVMGHVDHGKTSLLDYIREENVIAGESGGITQHIGAYGVELENGQKIAFLDTPGHEAFTAMRARGAKVTDLAIIVVAADDDIMPQTKEAISHAQAAGVPIVFAINKIDKPTANAEKIKEGLAQMNLLVEDWGGKIQSQDISAKTGQGVKELLEKVLLEAELLELKANPNKLASGTVVEAFLDKGRGYVSTILVQAGTLKVGDFVLASH